MSRISRRKFLKDTAFAGLGSAIGTQTLLSAPSVLTRRRSKPTTGQGELVFRPTFVQRGRGPHLLDWAYASDQEWDAFHTNIAADASGVRISDLEGKGRFGINVRWNVEGYGYTFLTADNGGDFYELPPAGTSRELSLNIEILRSRVARNTRRLRRHAGEGWVPSSEVQTLHDLSRGYLEDAEKSADGERQGELAQTGLRHALFASEQLELEKAWFDIRKTGERSSFLFGCDSRALFEMHENLFMDKFSELFNYATITYVWKSAGVMEDFEPAEGQKNFAMRDLMFEKLRGRGIAIEGRPLFWFHTWVTPEWLKTKTFDQLLTYVENTTQEVVGHYGDAMYGWEIVNELHDWANECRLSPEQTIELTRLACEVAKSVAPSVHRVVNNCCPYAEYVQLKQWSGQEATYPQRTPLQFSKDLVDAGVDVTVFAQQMYYPYRDLQDIVLLLERYQALGKPLQISEIGASSGPSEASVKLGKVLFPKEPYPWRRPWDEELQADWLEGVFTLAYSKRYIEAANWFDFVDPYSYIDNGGLLRSPEGETKASYDRLAGLQRRLRAVTKG